MGSAWFNICIDWIMAEDEFAALACIREDWVEIAMVEPWNWCEEKEIWGGSDTM